MRTSAFIICLSSILAVTAGCDVLGPVPGLSHAAATLGCGPADEPLTIIMLAHEPIGSRVLSAPYVTITLPEFGGAAAGHTWSVADAGVSTRYVPRPDVTESATRGSITITSVDSTRRMEGSVDLEFPSRIVSKQFSAPWLESGVLCG